MGTIAGDRSFTGNDLTHDVDVLRSPSQGLLERLSIPTLDNLRPGNTEAEHQSAIGQVIEGERRHGHGGRAYGRRAGRGQYRGGLSWFEIPTS